MNEKNRNEVEKLQKEISEITSELNGLISKNPGELTPEDESRFSELNGRIKEVKKGVVDILAVVETSKERLGVINKKIQLYKMVSLEEIEDEPNEKAKLEDRIAIIQGANLTPKIDTIDSLVIQVDKQFEKSREIKANKSRAERLEEKRKAIHELFGTTDPNPQVLLMVSRRYDDNEAYNRYKSSILRTPISAAAVRLMEITGASETYNYKKSRVASIDYDMHSWGCETKYSTEQELLERKDFDGVNAIRMYKDKVAEVATNPRYQREVVLKIPVYLELGESGESIPKPAEYVEVRCTESELAQRLGMLAMDLLPELEVKEDMSATDYFNAANSPSRVEPKRNPSSQQMGKAPEQKISGFRRLQMLLGKRKEEQQRRGPSDPDNH